VAVNAAAAAVDEVDDVCSLAGKTARAVRVQWPTASGEGRRRCWGTITTDDEKRRKKGLARTK